MGGRTYWEYVNPTEVTLKIVHGYGRYGSKFCHKEEGIAI